MNKKSVYLRAFEPDDYKLISVWRNDPNMQDLTSGTYRHISSLREKDWVLNKINDNVNDIYWAICVNDETKKMIGYTSVNNIDFVHRKADHGGIIIGDVDYRDGFSLIDTIILTLDYVFMELNINRIEALCLSKHKTSIKMLKMMGYSLEGLKRQSKYKHGEYNDQYVYSILKSEYKKLSQEGNYSKNKIIKRLRN